VSSPPGRVAAVWRGDGGTPPAQTRNHERLAPILGALRDVGLAVEPVLYSDVIADDVADQLGKFDVVLVWVDPISGDGDRTVLDAVLREVASRGVWVSAHPDTIVKMGTKEVLYWTRGLSWGADTRLYTSVEEFRDRFPVSLLTGEPRVLKQNRGNGGIGVWKVVPLDPDVSLVRVQHAAPRDDATEDVPLGEFIERCAPMVSGGGKLVDQPFSERITEGLIRAYLVEREVVGFARQEPTRQSDDPTAPDLDRVLGLPSSKTMYAADADEFARLREQLETEWIPGLCELVQVGDAELPVLWDADFLLGPRRRGEDSYMLCEINVSSVIPFPNGVPVKLATAVARRLEHS
jgi:uncharacterized protein DUF6815